MYIYSMLITRILQSNLLSQSYLQIQGPALLDDGTPFCLFFITKLILGDILTNIAFFSSLVTITSFCKGNDHLYIQTRIGRQIWVFEWISIKESEKD